MIEIFYADSTIQLMSCCPFMSYCHRTVQFMVYRREEKNDCSCILSAFPLGWCSFSHSTLQESLLVGTDFSSAHEEDSRCWRDSPVHKIWGLIENSKQVQQHWKGSNIIQIDRKPHALLLSFASQLLASLVHVKTCLHIEVANATLHAYGYGQYVGNLTNHQRHIAQLCKCEEIGTRRTISRLVGN
jgi:hypothetical protein